MASPAPDSPDAPASPSGRDTGRYVLRKLPHVTALFWLLKIVAVTIGETGSDEFAIELQLGYLGAAIVFFVFFLVMVGWQLRARRFHPGVFWTVIMATSLVGTAVSDLMDRGIGHSGKVTSGIGYGPGAIILISLLLVVFLVWWRTGQTYDVENIATRRGETLYWIAILVSNTLGTAAGDWLADDTGLGFVAAGGIIAAIMLVLLAGHYLTPIPTLWLFWPAFVLTRPLSAASGDALTKDPSDGGLGLGPLGATVLLVIVLAALITYQARRVRREPLELLPAPTHRLTGQAQQPNGASVLAHGPRPEQIVEAR